jgi:hypothetical protein
VGASSDWQDITYQDTYEKELRGIRRRMESAGGCTLEDLEGTLKHLYIMDGQDWLGRGEVQSLILAATIAAYETVIVELKPRL